MSSEADRLAGENINSIRYPISLTAFRWFVLVGNTNHLKTREIFSNKRMFLFFGSGQVKNIREEKHTLIKPSAAQVTLTDCDS